MNPFLTLPPFFLRNTKRSVALKEGKIKEATDPITREYWEGTPVHFSASLWSFIAVLKKEGHSEAELLKLIYDGAKTNAGKIKKNVITYKIVIPEGEFTLQLHHGSGDVWGETVFTFLFAVEEPWNAR